MLTLDALITRWRGRCANLVLDVDHNRASYDGILDGPYLGGELGVGLILGERLVSGDIVVGGTYVEIAYGRSGRRPLLVGDRYVELQVDEPPNDVTVEGNSARWSVRLVDGATLMCWLSVSEPAFGYASATRPEHQG